MAYHTIVPDILNNRWTKAVAIAAGFCVTRDAIIAVTVVPMFEPTVYGKICSTVNIPAPTSGTMSDVTIELDWTIAVKSNPIARLRTEFENR